MQNWFDGQQGVKHLLKDCLHKSQIVEKKVCPVTTTTVYMSVSNKQTSLVLQIYFIYYILYLILKFNKVTCINSN